MKLIVFQSRIHRQRGASLIIGLLFLIVLTLLGVTSMSKAVMEEKVVHNQRDTTVAMQSAESGLRNIETWLNTQPVRPLTVAMGGTVVKDNGTYTGQTVNTQTAAWWTANGIQYGALTTNVAPLPNVASQPRIVTQQLAWVPDNLGMATNYAEQAGVAYYEVSAQGAGQNAATRVTLQSVYAKRFN